MGLFFTQGLLLKKLFHKVNFLFGRPEFLQTLKWLLHPREFYTGFLGPFKGLEGKPFSFSKIFPQARGYKIQVSFKF